MHGAVLSALQGLISLIPTTRLKGRFYHLSAILQRGRLRHREVSVACPLSHSQQDEAIGFEPKISCRGAHGLNNSLNLRIAWESRDSSSRLIRADTACRAWVAGAGDLGTAVWESTLGTGLRGLRTVTKRSAPCGLCERLGKDPNQWREWPGDGGGGLAADRSCRREGARGTAFRVFIDRTVPMIRPKAGGRN